MLLVSEGVCVNDAVTVIVAEPDELDVTETDAVPLVDGLPDSEEL